MIRIETDRLLLITYSSSICQNILKSDYSDLINLSLNKGKGWPDADVLDTLPRILNNLEKVSNPTGFESWMIVKKDTMEVIGDIGFKGLNTEDSSADIGYGIIEAERRKGYAGEAAIGLLKWAKATNQVKFFTASCLADNHNSIALLNKLGFQITKKEPKWIYWSYKID